MNRATNWLLKRHKVLTHAQLGWTLRLSRQGKEASHKRLCIGWGHIYAVPIVGKSIGRESRLVVARIWGTGKWLFKGYRMFFWGNAVLELERGGGCTTPWMYQMPLNSLLPNSYLCHVNFTPIFKKLKLLKLSKERNAFKIDKEGINN